MLTSEKPLLECNNVCAGYLKKNVLKNINLSLDRGKITILLGPNGSGKSTFLKTISNTIQPTSGTIKIDNQKVANLSPKQRAQKIAYVPQEEIHQFDFTAKEIILMGRLAHSDGLFETKNDHEIATELRYRAIHKRYAISEFNCFLGYFVVIFCFKEPV